MDQPEVVAVVYEELLKVAGGASVVLAGLSAFLGSVWIKRIVNREAQARDEKLAEMKASFDRQNTELKARLDVNVQRSVFVDKLQFEHEYEIYKQAWGCLFSLQQVTLKLRPTLDSVDPSESREERMRRRIGEFVTPFNAYLEVIEKNKPFYPEEVYAALADVREKCRVEVIDFEYTERPHKDYWAEARKNHQEIVDAIEKACNVIRKRVAEVRVA